VFTNYKIIKRIIKKKYDFSCEQHFKICINKKKNFKFVSIKKQTIKQNEIIRYGGSICLFYFPHQIQIDFVTQLK
jgi:hypothetical protein